MNKKIMSKVCYIIAVVSLVILSGTVFVALVVIEIKRMKKSIKKSKKYCLKGVFVDMHKNISSVCFLF